MELNQSGPVTCPNRKFPHQTNHLHSRLAHHMIKLSAQARAKGYLINRFKDQQKKMIINFYLLLLKKTNYKNNH